METEPSTSDAAEAYFEPLGVKSTLGRAVDVFRRRWKHLLLVSAIPIFLWYLVAIGIRKAFGTLSASNVEYLSFEMNGETFSYPWEKLRTTFSRVGLIAEFFLLFLLFVPADAMNVRTVAVLYAGRDAEGVRPALRAVLPKIPSLALVCVVWCTALMLPLASIVWYMAPEGETAQNQNGNAVYYEPWPTKLGFGLVYLIASSAFIMATCLSHPMLTVKGGRPIASLKESFELFQKSRSHVGAVTVLWFLIKVAITKFVTVLNYMYYLHEKRFWVVWDQPGIPLHPIRILWSTSLDLWEIGTSWISVPFVVFLAAMGSVFKAVLYVDARVMHEDHTGGSLRGELGLDEGEETTEDYKTMENEGEETTEDYKTMDNELPASDGGVV